MDGGTLRIIEEGSDQDVCRVLEDFNGKNEQTFNFPELQAAAKQGIVEALFTRLQQKDTEDCHMMCLHTLRLFSREKDKLDSMITEQALELLIKLAGLEYLPEDEEVVGIRRGNTAVMVEALKCLCNLIFNNLKAQRICSKNGCVEGIVQRLKTYKDPELKFDIKFLDMRMLFLLTALVADTRPKIRYDLHGFTYLMEVIDLTLRDAEEAQIGLTDDEVDLCNEILKILFNITVTVDKNSLDEEEEAHFMRLVSVLRDLLMFKTVSKDKRDELQKHTVNLLTNMPKDCYEELLIPLIEGDVGGIENKEVEFDGKNMEAIVVLLDFLYRRLDRPTKSLKESLTPILHCLCETCKTNRAIRKFCRTKVLPPLKDEVKRLPEEGDSLRNRLCKLLTSTVTEVKDLCADLIFILCKESVQRMVKYTGYGNCAGLLANRGLMLGGPVQGDYSSDSEDSETEEYCNLKTLVNPVTGRWEEDKSDPMAGMSDEQKEFEAMKLVEAMDKLQRQGVIQPSRIGPGGHPVPIGGIQELAATLNIPNITQEAESDSD